MSHPARKSENKLRERVWGRLFWPCFHLSKDRRQTVYSLQFELRPASTALISLIFFLISKQSRIPSSAQLDRWKSHVCLLTGVAKADSEDLPSSTSRIRESRIQASTLSQEKEQAISFGSCLDSSKEIGCTHIYFYWL